MKKKQIKVTKGCTKDHTPVPRVAVQGHWLGEFGFSIGDSLIVICEDNKITILKCMDDYTVEKNGMVAEPAAEYGRKGA